MATKSGGSSQVLLTTQSGVLSTLVSGAKMIKELRLVATLGAGQPEGETSLDRHLIEVEYSKPNAYVRYFKRLVDLIGASTLLVLLTPVLALVAILVRIQVGTPVIFIQERVGRHGRVFTIYKFRTMIPDRRQAMREFPGPDRRQVHKSPDDPRVVSLGRTLRRLSLDELPQLWNVVKGEMSLVGPRPELPEIVADYEEWQHARHAVKPGITCFWQISNRDQLLKDSTELDLRYIESMSFLTDLRILVATPLAALGRRRGF